MDKKDKCQSRGQWREKSPPPLGPRAQVYQQLQNEECLLAGKPSHPGWVWCLGRTGWIQRVSHIQTILSAHPDFLGLYKSINVPSLPTKLSKLDFEQSEAAFRRPWHRNEQLKGTSKGSGHKDAFFC